MDQTPLTIQEVKSIMMSIFAPLLKLYLSRSDPKKWEQWQGNCCRQTAIIGCALLSKLLPDWQWFAFEAKFNDKIEGKPVTYEHAWILGKDPSGQRWLIDLSRTHKPLMFEPVDTNTYNKNWRGYEDMTEVDRHRLDWQEMLKEQEYYSGMTGQEVADLMTMAMINHLGRSSDAKDNSVPG